ncbi:MAG TPA: PEP-CTERM sorting domain-containing protein [Isosphaeraceae bacterium]|jgi:hypothetical protein|nr:PEP-CTERM sorting domain-containing protein [Isosphaeraceae bacterium]
MHRTRRWTGLGSALAALLLGAWFAPQAGAAAMSSDSIKSFMEYSTSGTIDSTGVTGTPVIGFNSVAGGAFTAPSSFSLGEFLVAALPDGVSTTYNNTPFHITYLANKVDGSVPSVNGTPITLNGVLNGTVHGGSQSDVVASFTTPGPTPFQTGNFTNTLNLLDSPVSLVPSTTNGGRTTAQAQIIVQAVTPPAIPEPTSIAVFLTAIAGLCLRRRLRRAIV